MVHAFDRYCQHDIQFRKHIARFEQQHSYWVPDYALYRVLKQQHENKPWFHWPRPLRNRDPDALVEVRKTYCKEIQFHIFEQFLFRRQWKRLKDYANEHDIRIMGDMPIFVAHDSADVWVSPQYFQLDASGHPLFVAGVPPDYFSTTGQLWGNPVYDWRQMREDGFAWWVERFRSQLELFDLLRLDHFRGYESYWSIPADSEDATTGHWVEIPGADLFEVLYHSFGRLPLIAEDLGYITAEVEELKGKLGLPGMRVLQFAFDGDTRNLHLPHNHEAHSVVYTGTHDNSTTLGWFSQLAPEEQERICEYLGNTSDPMPQALVRAAMASIARLVVLPLQDVMALGDAHRMNTPGTARGNWMWRFDWSDLPYGTADWLRHLASVYGR